MFCAKGSDIRHYYHALPNEKNTQGLSFGALAGDRAWRARNPLAAALGGGGGFQVKGGGGLQG